MAQWKARYTPLLVWAVLRKFEKGMGIAEIEQVYGIPKSTVGIWAYRALRGGK